jgi:hypothetical protein
MSIDLSKLPKEVVDTLLMQEDTEPTYGNCLSEDYSEILFKTLDERRKPGSQHSFIASWYGRQGSSKSWSALALSGFLDSNFNIDNIFFDIEELVNNRSKLKPGNCVLVDEMARSFGLDSMRINIMISTIKEQLRKKSIHMFYLSPTLKEEYHSSQYVFETMFLDKENKISFHAYKTNKLLCLGYVIVPHPLHFISKKLLLDYERKKDEHLKEVLEGPKDLVEERAQQIMCNDYFKRAEQLYLKARGYITYKILVQIVEKIFPEFKGSVIVYELADRIKADREISGKWNIVGSSKKDD